MKKYDQIEKNIGFFGNKIKIYIFGNVSRTLKYYYLFLTIIF